MAKDQGRVWFRAFVISVVSGLVVTPITGWISFRFGQRNLSTEVAEGLELLDLDSTAQSLERFLTSSDHASSLLRQRTPHPARASTVLLSDSLERLSKAIDGVSTTEFYSVQELKELARSGGAKSEITLFGADSSYERFIKEHINKPKRTVDGLAQVKPQLEIVRETAAKIALQLDEHSSVDIPAVETALSEMKREASAALAALNARRHATLETLKRFGRNR